MLGISYHRLPPGGHKAFAVLSIGLMMALASVGLAACGYAGAQQGNAPSTHPPAQVTHPPVKVQKCGVVQGLGSLEAPVSDSGAQRVETCLWQAFQHCHPATLVFIRNSPGTALIRTFTISSDNGTCSISDARQQRIASNPPSAAEVYTCTSLLQKPGGLLFIACGKDGDVLVPAS
jgi:hypothetical protein